jgi:hypothetical protein
MPQEIIEPNVTPGVKTRGNLRYPIDDIEKHFGKITFKVIDEDAARVNIGKALGQATNTIVKESGDTAAAAEKTVSGANNIIESLTKAFSSRSVSRNRSIADEAASYRLREQDLLIDPAAGSVSLYLPQQIQIQDGASYENMDLGRIGAGAEATMQSGGSVGSAISAAAAEVGGQVGDIAGLIKGGALSPGIASLAAQSVTPQGVTGAIQSATGIATNPNTRTLFKSVPTRNFAFSFDLIPSSAEEARIIKDIIKWFRTELYPTALALSTGVNYGYRFPNRFQIKMKYRDKQDPDGSFNGIKFLPVYLTNFSTQYNTAGQALHADGNFQAISINMNFMESRPLTRQDVEEYGY